MLCIASSLREGGALSPCEVRYWPAAGAFEVELPLEGLVDRLDPLTHAAGVAGAVGLVLAVRA
jgi:hypothetical protein